MTLVRLNFIDTYLQYLSTYFCPRLYIHRQGGRFVQFFFSLSFLSFRTLAKFLIRRLSFFLLSPQYSRTTADPERVRVPCSLDFASPLLYFSAIRTLHSLILSLSSSQRRLSFRVCL